MLDDADVVYITSYLTVLWPLKFVLVFNDISCSFDFAEFK